MCPCETLAHGADNHATVFVFLWPDLEPPNPIITMSGLDDEVEANTATHNHTHTHCFEPPATLHHCNAPSGAGGPTWTHRVYQGNDEGPGVLDSCRGQRPTM
jgi:hypothetical protein